MQEKMDTPFFDFCTDEHHSTGLVYLNIVNLTDFDELYSITALWLIGLRPNDYICMYDCKEIREICKFYQRYFHYQEDQFIFWNLSEVQTQKDISIVLEKVLKYFQGQNVKIVSLVLYPELKEVCAKLNLKTCANEMGILPDKRMLQPSVPNSPYKNNIWNLPKLQGVSIPQGYSCYSLDEISTARRLLQEKGIKSLYFKHAQALSGILSYILKDISNDDDFEKILSNIKFEIWTIYTYQAQPCWIVEEFITLKQVEEENLLIGLDLTKDLSKYNASIALSVIKDKVCYSLVNYACHRHACAVTNFASHPNLLREAEKQYENLALVLKGVVNYPAEIEFIIDQAGCLYLTDLNFRFSAKDQIFFFLEKTGTQNKSWMHRTIKFNLSVEKLILILENNGLLFNFQNLVGVMPDVPIPNAEFQSLLFVGNDIHQVELMIQQTFKLIIQQIGQ